MKDEDSNQAENESVKSRAIVKYSLPKPARYTKLQCNTDLNLPPSNWLSSAADSYGLQQVMSHPKGFTSFRMAHMFPDCVGEVDVVSDAENIKKLLKIPYHKGHISMMVHRVGNTLLLDDFDIYKHLLKTAETEWEWLRKFFFENINRATCEEDKNLYIRSRRREALKEKSLVSKFLYYSLGEDGVQQSPTGESSNVNYADGPLLPEPSPSAECPDHLASHHKHTRNVVWTFEDIEMLIGTDMPIFGGGTHPCISLRLRDMSKPISVLTGIDYWLDNLMSNVPEVVMCYHLNGIVQKYELVKTEDLPRLDNSKFSPQLIRDVAQSILSFLKSNATRAGHTYWLFKGKDEEVVKLYDLTSLCSETDYESAQNPFTVPVAMLLYRVARNMKHSEDRRQPGTIRMLLKNCLRLLPEEKYPEIVTSSLYMLSDLYVPANTNPECPDGMDEDQDEDANSVYDDDLNNDPDKDSDSDLEKNTKILVLNNNNRYKNCYEYKPPPPIIGNIEERCLQAIQHVSAGLNCLKYFPEEEKEETKVKDEEVKMAKPFEPIPMPYAKLNEEIKEEQSSAGSKKSKRKERKKRNSHSYSEGLEKVGKNNDDPKNAALLLKTNNKARPLPTWRENATDRQDISWKDHLKTLLYEKAVLIYAILSEFHFVSGNYGSGLRCIGLLVRCQLIMNRLQYASSALRENCLLGRAGDCCIMMVQHWSKSETYAEQLRTLPEEDSRMTEQLERDERLYGVNIALSDMRCVFVPDVRTVEQMLSNAVQCYRAALNISETESILRRLGNSLNESASHCLSKAKTMKTHKDVAEMCRKAEAYLTSGLQVFEKVKDEPNVALLYTNAGHMHRLLAHACAPPDRGPLTAQEKQHLDKALTNYKRALQVLGERELSPAIWDAVTWELSTALFNMATIAHENPPRDVPKDQAERRAIELLQRALRYCDVRDEQAPKFPLYQYRAAVIHYRIGSLHHGHVWSASACGNDIGYKKNVVQLAKIHYEKASSLYFQSQDAVNYFTSQMQRFALSEYLAETTGITKNKIKHLQHCLEIVMELEDMLGLLEDKKVEIGEEEEENCKETGDEEYDLCTSNGNEKKLYATCFSLLKLVRMRLQHVLKTLVKICSSRPAQSKDVDQLAQMYRDCYKVSFELTDGLDYEGLLRALLKVVKKIKVIQSERFDK